MWFVNWLLSFVGGPLSKTLVQMTDTETARFKAATGADRDVLVAQIQAHASAWHDRAALLAGMKLTQWFIAMALVPALYHEALVIFDSCPFLPGFDWDFPFFHFLAHQQGSWRVAALPAPYPEREWELIASLLGLQSAVTVGASFARYLHR